MSRKDFYTTSSYLPNIMNDLSTWFQKQHQLVAITEYSKQSFTYEANPENNSVR